MLLSLLLLVVLFILLPAFVPNSSPYRHTICLICLTVYLTVLGILLIPIYIWRPSNPRNFRLCRHAIQVLALIIGMDYEFLNTEAVKKTKKHIIIANHQSYFDAVGIPLVSTHSERLAVISTNGVKYLGTLGLATWLAGFIFVKRFKGGVYPNLKKQVQKHFSSDEIGSIIIFPEGGIGPGKELMKFKSGPFRLAAELNVPILPLVISKYHISSDETIFSRGKVLAEFMEPIYVKEDMVEEITTKTREVMQIKYDQLNQKVKTVLGKNIQ